MDAQQIQALIEACIPDARVAVSGGDGKFEATVVSPAFAGVPPVKRHQMVYGAVRAQIADGSLHALTIRPVTPDEHAAAS